MKTMMVVEDTWGSDIATAASVHLGVTVPPKYLLNVCDLSGYVSPHLASDGPLRDNGSLTPGTGPGLGITVDEAILGDPELEILHWRSCTGDSQRVHQSDSSVQESAVYLTCCCISLLFIE